MLRERLAAGEALAGRLLGAGAVALRSIVDRWPAPWAQRRFMGERLGVWVLAVLWLSLPVLAGAFLHYCNH